MKKELSSKTIEIIKSTGGIVVANAPEISIKMFEILFSRYPDIEKLFAFQSRDQYMVLAESLSNFIVNIEKIDKLTPALDTIAVVHVEHNIYPEHYPLVGMALMSAMEDILKDTATLEFVDAWREAYKYLSDILIEMEEKMYKEIKN